jgi:carboxylesterase type B
MSKSDEKFITVSSNYRLGATGWISSPDRDLLPNAGIWDALVALEWTQKYIGYFGGDADRITAMGESAGGGIIDHLITARGGSGSLPFQQVRINTNIPFIVIIQSSC